MQDEKLCRVQLLLGVRAPPLHKCQQRMQRWKNEKRERTQTQIVLQRHANQAEVLCCTADDTSGGVGAK